MPSHQALHTPCCCWELPLATIILLAAPQPPVLLLVFLEPVFSHQLPCYLRLAWLEETVAHGPRKMKEKITAGLGWGAAGGLCVGGWDRKSKPAWQGDSGCRGVHETQLLVEGEGPAHVGGSTGGFGNTGFGKALEAECENLWLAGGHVLCDVISRSPDPQKIY